MDIFDKRTTFNVFKYSVRNFLEKINYIQIPLYQREYVWGKEQVETLLEDIKARLFDSNEHYFGIIAKSQKKEKSGWSEIYQHRIIDGQQRITTAIILIHCLSIEINELDFKSEGGFIKEFKNINFHNEINTITSETITKIVSLENKYISINSNSKVQEVIEIIYDFLENNDSIDLKDFLRTFLDKFIFAILEYNIQPSDEMLIFENLNSKGAPLSEYDLIKNTIISYFDQFKGKENYKSLNEKVLNLLNSDEYIQKDISINKIFENFIESFLIWKSNSGKIEQFKSYKLYKNLKIFLDKHKKYSNLTFEAFISELRKYLTLYLSVKYPYKKEDIGNNLWFRVIKQRNFHMPFVFEIFTKYSKYQENKWESNEKIIKFMQVLASHVIKYVSVHGSEQEFDKLIFWMINWISKHNLNPNDIKKRLKDTSSSLEATPTNKQFAESCTREQKNNKWISWSIIDIIDNFQKDNQQNFELIKKRTKEYIMPISPKGEAWPALNDRDKSINNQKIHKHQIGNLLFLNNLKKGISGSKSFKEKKTEYYCETNSCLITSEGLKEYGVKPLLNYDDWGFNEIKERTKSLAETVLKIMDNLS